MKKLDTTDNIYTSEENKLIRWYKVWAVLGPLAGLISGILLGILI